jgi:ubiquinone/menaquinone biosynthesis C-methylase UbiE
VTDRFRPEQIRDFWTVQARTHGQASAASWTDGPAIELEIMQLLQRLRDGDDVLDVGCGNGHSTMRLAAGRRIKIRGVDYIPEMIDHARRRLASVAATLRERVQFDVGDVTALNEPMGAYDKVVAVRVIINVHSWTKQQAALRECGRVLKPGGVLLLSEATLQGWSKLNAMRREWSLPDIPMPAFNQYLDEEQVIEAVRPNLELVELVNFASTYYVGTRVLKPLLSRSLSMSIDVANTDMEWNRWCASLPAWGDYGTQKLFVFRKR